MDGSESDLIKHLKLGNPDRFKMALASVPDYDLVNLARQIVTEDRTWAIAPFLEQERNDDATLITRFAVRHPERDAYEAVLHHSFHWPTAVRSTVEAEHDPERTVRIIEALSGADGAYVNPDENSDFPRELAGPMCGLIDNGIETLFEQAAFREKALVGPDCLMVALLDREPDLAGTILSLSDNVVWSVVEQLLQKEGEQWVVHVFGGQSSTDRPILEELSVESYQDVTDRLMDRLDGDPDAPTVQRLVHDGACPFVDDGAPYRALLDVFSGDEQRSILRVIHDQYSGEYEHYFDDPLRELRDPVDQGEHDAVEFFLNNSSYGPKQLEVLFCRLLERGDFRTARMAYVRSKNPPEMDAESFEQFNTERFFEKVQKQPAVNVAPIVPLFSETKAAQLLYEVTLTASEKDLRTFVKRTDFETKHYERAAAYAFLAYEQDATEAIIDETTSHFDVLKRFLALSALTNNKAVLPGIEEEHTLLRAARDFAEQAGLTDEQAATVYGRLIEALLNQQHPSGFANMRSEPLDRHNTSPLFVTRFLDAFRESVEAEPEALDPVYEALIDHERAVPELLRYLIDWRKPAREQAGQLSKHDAYERVLRETLNGRELKAAGF